VNGSIVVTGAARGIGRAIAERLAANPSFTVIGVDLAPELALVGDIVAVQVDLTSDDGIDSVHEAVDAAGVPLLGVVNNAGITRDGLLMRMSDEDLDRVIDVNLKGAFYFVRALTRPLMKAKGSSIVNITSVVGITGNAGQSSYAASKAGLLGLTKSLAQELAGRAVTANVVAPGFIETDMTDQLPEEVKQAILMRIPQQRMGTPEEVAEVVAWLATRASYVNGGVIHVNGGMYGG